MSLYSVLQRVTQSHCHRGGISIAFTFHDVKQSIVTLRMCHCHRVSPQCHGQTRGLVGVVVPTSKPNSQDRKGRAGTLMGDISTRVLVD